MAADPDRRRGSGTGVCEKLECPLPCGPQSVTDGRHLLAEALGRWGLDEDPEVGYGVLADAMLIVTELLANAVRVCTRTVVLRLEAHQHDIRIVVCDDNSSLAVPRQADQREEGGRGLAIVAAVAKDWGQQAFDGSTKEVWATVPVPAGARLKIACCR